MNSIVDLMDKVKQHHLTCDC